MSLAIKMFCHQERSWFHTLSMDQLKEVCEAANIGHMGLKEANLITCLRDNVSTGRFCSITIPQLKKMCKSRSIPFSGSTYEIVLRVLRHDKNDGNSTTNQTFEFVHDEEIKEAIIHGNFSHIEKAIVPGTISHAQAVYALLANRIDDIHYNFYCSEFHKTPAEGFKIAQSVFLTVIDFIPFITQKEIDSDKHLNVAIDRLASIIFEVHPFLKKEEKKIAIQWITELDCNFSQRMLGGNFKVSLKELVDLLDEEHGPTSVHKHQRIPAETIERTHQVFLRRAPLMPCDNRVARSKRETTWSKPEIKNRMMATKKEMVYKHVVNVIEMSNSRGGSDYVYDQLVRVIRKITNEPRNDGYKSLCLVEAAFKAIIVRFRVISNPRRDTNHNFTTAIDILFDLVVTVLPILSKAEKENLIQWITVLGALTAPFALGDIAEYSLQDIITLLQESKRMDATKRSREFLPYHVE